MFTWIISFGLELFKVGSISLKPTDRRAQRKDLKTNKELFRLCFTTDLGMGIKEERLPLQERQCTPKHGHGLLRRERNKPGTTSHICTPAILVQSPGCSPLSCSNFRVRCPVERQGKVFALLLPQFTAESANYAAAQMAMHPTYCAHFCQV